MERHPPGRLAPLDPLDLSEPVEPVAPLELRNDRRDRVLHIVWSDGATQQLPHALLRAQCKCTVCQSQRLLAGAMGVAWPASASGVAVTDLRQVGLYGVQLVFSDGHERGIYPWAYLRTLEAPVAIA